MLKKAHCLPIGSVFAAFILVAGLHGQARIGGHAGGGGIRAGGGGAGFSTGGAGSAGMRFSSATRARGSGVSSGPRVRGLESPNTVHPQGYIGSPAAAARRGGSTGPGGVSGNERGTTRIGTLRGSTVIREPGSDSIPPLTRSIPPLERPGTDFPPGSVRLERGSVFTFSGRHGGFFGNGGFLQRFPVVVVPYAYHGYGSYYDDRNVIVIDSGAQTRSSSEYVVTPQPQAPPEPLHPVSPKVIEVQPAEPESAEESPDEGAPAEKQAEGPVLYLIAFKGGEIHASKEQWLEGRTVRYVTVQGESKEAPLDQVDMNFTVQLNEERGLSFVLEVRKQGR